MTPLDQVIQHIRAQGRVGTHGAILLAEIERLRAIIAATPPQSPTDAPDPPVVRQLTQDVDALLARSGGCTCPPDDAPTPCSGKHALQDCLAAVEMCGCGSMSAVNCGSMPSRHCGMWDYTEEELRDLDT